MRIYVCIYLSLGTAFGGFTLRERQNTRVRVEVSSTNPITNEKRKFASMFAAVEEKKTELRIQEYSIAQTSLEQIFNQFAAQQGTYGYLLCRYTLFSSSLLSSSLLSSSPLTFSPFLFPHPPLSPPLSPFYHSSFHRGRSWSCGGHFVLGLDAQGQGLGAQGQGLLARLGVSDM